MFSSRDGSQTKDRYFRDNDLRKRYSELVEGGEGDQAARYLL